MLSLFTGIPWKLIGLSAVVMAFALLFAHDRMIGAQNAKLKAQIIALEKKSREQKIEVREVIKQGKDRIVTVEKRVREIEKAPLPGNCGTPKEVLQADL